MRLDSDDYAQALFEAEPRRIGGLSESDFPKEPGIYMFSEGEDVMWIGRAEQGIRQRVFKHQLLDGRRSWLPIGANGKTRQQMGCNLVLWIAKERIQGPLDMAKRDHRVQWRAAVDRVFRMDIRWLILPAVAAERAAKQRRKPRYGR